MIINPQSVLSENVEFTINRLGTIGCILTFKTTCYGRHNSILNITVHNLKNLKAIISELQQMATTLEQEGV